VAAGKSWRTRGPSGAARSVGGDNARARPIKLKRCEHLRQWSYAARQRPSGRGPFPSAALENRPGVSLACFFVEFEFGAKWRAAVAATQSCTQRNCCSSRRPNVAVGSLSAEPAQIVDALDALEEKRRCAQAHRSASTENRIEVDARPALLEVGELGDFEGRPRSTCPADAPGGRASGIPSCPLRSEMSCFLKVDADGP